MSNFPRRSFAAGEIDPALYARTDWTRYSIGLRTMRNFFVGRSGGAYNRPGTKHVASTRNDGIARLMPLECDRTTDMMEIGPHYVRVYDEDDALLNWKDATSITAVTNANPCVVTSTSHGLIDGDEVYIASVGGTTELNGNYYVVKKLTANTFELHDFDGALVNSTSYGIYTSGGTATKTGSPFIHPSAATTITGATQANPGVITVTSHGYEDGQRVWIFGVKGMTELNGNVYAVKYINANTFSLQDEDGNDINTSSYTAYTSGGGAIPALFDTEVLEIQKVKDYPASQLFSHKRLITEQRIYRALTTPYCYMADAYNAYSTFAGSTASISVSGGPFGSGYIIGAAPVCITGEEGNINLATASAYLPAASTGVTITATFNAGFYEKISTNFYVDFGSGTYVFIGASSGGTIYIPSVASLLTSADYSRGPLYPASQYDLANGGTTGATPGVLATHGQRVIEAGSLSASNQVLLSIVGNTYFPIPSTLFDNSAFMFQIPQNTSANEIRHILGMRRVIIITAGGVFIAKGNDAGILTPHAINLEQHSYFGGAAYPQPVVIGDTAIYLQAQGNIVRDLAFEFSSDGYKGSDLTVNASHLVDGYTINDWAHQDAPNSILWMTRDDGKVLSLTYIREQEMLGWARHDTQGSFLRTASLKVGSNTRIYFIVEREINGSTKRFIERLQDRSVFSDTIEDAVFLDCAVTTDGRHTGTTTMTLSGGTNWTYDELLTLTASSGYFVSGDVGNEIRLRDVDGVEIRFAIAGFTSTTVVTGHADRTVPTSLRSTAADTWGKAITVVTGLSHLEGEDVSVFADGFVVASPNNASYSTLTVSSGSITLPRCYEVIHVGLPYVSDLETLDIDMPQGESLSDKRKLITAVTCHVYKTRSFWAGGEEPDDDTADTDLLTEAKARDDEDPNAPVSLQNTDIEINMQGSWSEGGRVFIRNVDPVPCAILSVIPTGLVPVRGGG